MPRCKDSNHAAAPPSSHQKMGGVKYWCQCSGGCWDWAIFELAKDNSTSKNTLCHIPPPWGDEQITSKRCILTSFPRYYIFLERESRSLPDAWGILKKENAEATGLFFSSTSHVREWHWIPTQPYVTHSVWISLLIKPISGNFRIYAEVQDAIPTQAILLPRERVRVRVNTEGVEQFLSLDPWMHGNPSLKYDHLPYFLWLKILWESLGELMSVWN